MDLCTSCFTPAPDGKVPASAALFRTTDTGGLVPTALGHLAARLGEEESKDMKIFQGRSAKAAAKDKMSPPQTDKVQSLTMTKVNLVSKLWGEKMKRGELWVCEKAASVTPGCTMVHSAGCFVGEFRVGRKPSFLISWFEGRGEGQPLPRRQDLPDDAFLDVSTLLPDQLDKLEVISISYCWLSPEHPDPAKFHLEAIVELLKGFGESSFTKAKECYSLGQSLVTKEDLLQRGYACASQIFHFESDFICASFAGIRLAPEMEGQWVCSGTGALYIKTGRSGHAHQSTLRSSRQHWQISTSGTPTA